MTLEFTTIQHGFRKKNNLTCNEYVLADMIYFLSTSPEAKVRDWCYMSRPTMAEELGLSKQSILNLISALIEKGFVIKDVDTSFLRTTKKWNVVYFKRKQDDFDGGKESLPLDNKFDKGSKESLPPVGKQSIPNTNKQDINNDTFSFTPDGVKGPASKAAKKTGSKNKPPVAAAPLFENGQQSGQSAGQSGDEEANGSDISGEGESGANRLKTPQTLYQCMIDKYDSWFKSANDNQPPKFDGAQGKACKAIITYLKVVVKAKMAPANDLELEQGVKDAWALVLDNWELLEPFYKKRTKLTEISSDLQNILKQLKDGRISKKAGNGNTVATAKGVYDAVNERLKSAGRG